MIVFKTRCGVLFFAPQFGHTFALLAISDPHVLQVTNSSIFDPISFLDKLKSIFYAILLLLYAHERSTSMENLTPQEQEVIQLMRKDNDFAQKIEEVIIKYMVNTLVDDWKTK